MVPWKTEIQGIYFKEMCVRVVREKKNLRNCFGIKYVLREGIRSYLEINDQMR